MQKQVKTMNVRHRYTSNGSWKEEEGGCCIVRQSEHAQHDPATGRFTITCELVTTWHNDIFRQYVKWESNQFYSVNSIVRFHDTYYYSWCCSDFLKHFPQFRENCHCSTAVESVEMDKSSHAAEKECKTRKGFWIISSEWKRTTDERRPTHT